MKNINILWRMINQLREILPYNQKKKIPFIIFAIFITSLLELLGVAMILPLINLLMDIDKFMGEEYVQILMHVTGITNGVHLISFMIGVIIVIYLMKNIFLLLVRNYINKFNVEIQHVLSVEMLDSFMSRPYSFFLQESSSVLNERLSGDVSGIYGIMTSMFVVVPELVTVLFIALYLIITNPFLASSIVLVALLIMIIIVYGFRNITSRMGVRYRTAQLKRAQNAYQALNGIKDIFVLNKRSYFLKKYRESYKELVDTYTKYNFIQMCPERITETVFIAGILLSILFQINIGVGTAEFVPQLAIIAVGAYRLLPSINKISTNFTQLIYNKPYLDSAYENFIQLRSYEKMQMQCSSVENKSNEFISREPLSFNNSILLKDVIYRYNDNQEPVLNGVSLEINKGELIGIVGESGAGKSTLGDVMLGLLRPESGSVYMDGQDIFSIPEKWSSIIGFVPQTVFMVDGTIRENIAFGLEESEISDEKVIQAVEMASLKEFIDGLPYGINTEVGERGVRLSGGQRQRIAIARALYYDPQIMVLDEATSALDSTTEDIVMDAINSMKKNKTLIVIAHRLTTLKECNRIIEIVDGKAIERKREVFFEN